jgi:hypothetical protein
MGIPSQPASNAIIYLTLGAFLYVPNRESWHPTSHNLTHRCDRSTTVGL